MDLVAAVGWSPVPLGPEVPLMLRYRHLSKVGEARRAIWSKIGSLLKGYSNVSSDLWKSLGPQPQRQRIPKIILTMFSTFFLLMKYVCPYRE